MNKDAPSATLPVMTWIASDSQLPEGEVLVVSRGRYHVAVLVASLKEGETAHQFMDARSDKVIDWPSHWMRLPEMPLVDALGQKYG